jgi:hypothetical protein
MTGVGSALRRPFVVPGPFHVSWYPGHMVSATRDILRRVARADVVIEARDARAPLTTRNAPLTSDPAVRRVPRVIALCKADLAHPALFDRVRRTVADVEMHRLEDPFGEEHGDEDGGGSRDKVCVFFFFFFFFFLFLFQSDASTRSHAQAWFFFPA